MSALDDALIRLGIGWNKEDDKLADLASEELERLRARIARLEGLLKRDLARDPTLTMDEIAEVLNEKQ